MAVFQVDFMAESLGRTVPIIVILPTDKVYFPGMPRREEGKPYKTLYLLHGIVGDCTDWLYGTRIRRWVRSFTVTNSTLVLCANAGCVSNKGPHFSTGKDSTLSTKITAFCHRYFNICQTNSDC